MDRPVKIFWLSYFQPEVLSQGYWDDGLLYDIFKRGNFIHYESQRSEFPLVNTFEGGIVVINGRSHVNATRQINEDIARLKWVIFIITGDEESVFPWEKLRHPRLRVWVQMPRMNRHNDVYKLPNGYRPETSKILKEIGLCERVNDWMFAGQVTHERRIQCIEHARNLDNGVLIETHEFGAGIDYREYLEHMARSKVVLCPSGPQTPDTFRLYEALEAGCIPIVDAFSSNNQAPGFWNYLFGEDPPFPIVSYWDALPKLMPELLREYPANANKIFSWWQQKKWEIFNKLQDEIRSLDV